MEAPVKKGDLVRSYGFARLYPDNESFINDDGTSGIVCSRDNELMILLGRAKFMYVRVLHPEYGPRRVHRDEIRLVTQ